MPLGAKFFFQLVFAGTAATIVSGAVAERIKYLSFIVFSAFMAIVIYPVVGHWIWGGGWLAQRRLPRFRRLDAGALDRRLGGAWSASTCLARASASTRPTASLKRFPVTT